MRILSASAFDKAAEYIAKNARPLERAQFNLHFRAGSLEAVLDELQKFQNDDGGFGHGVEPDIQMPFSSPLVSSVAFQVLRDVSAPTDHKMVRSGIAYFERSFNRSIGGWEQVTPESNNYPRASWWNYQPVTEGDRLSPLLQSNPGAEILGYLRMYADQAHSNFIDEVTEQIFDAFDRLPDDMEEHVMMCFVRLAEMSPGRIADRLLPKLRRGVLLVTGKSSEDWESYGGRPLWFADGPNSLLADDLADPIQNELDYLIDTQTDDGSWQPPWSWGQYDQEWEPAKVEWAGWLTLKNLLALKARNRI
jgi:hypothetical protein